MLKNIDLIIVIIISVLIFPVESSTSGIARVILGVVFILILPGYALVSALFPARKSINILARFLVSIGTSMAISALIGVVLNFTPYGIRLWPITVSMVCFIFITTGIAWLRRLRLPADERFSLMEETGCFISAVFPATLNRKYRIITLFVVMVVAAGLLSFIVIRSNLSQGEKANEFYIFYQGGITQNYPRSLRVGETVTVDAVIINHESQPAEYAIQLTLDEHEVARYEQIRVDALGKWEKQLSVIPGNTGNNQKIVYKLLRAGASEPESVLYIYIDVNG